MQEPYGAPCTTIREPETPSLSLHSSPSSLLGSLGSCSPSNPSSPTNHAGPVPEEGNTTGEKPNEGERSQTEEQNKSEEDGKWSKGCAVSSQDEVSSTTSPVSELDLELKEENSPCHNNNKDGCAETRDRPRYRLRRGNGEFLLHQNKTTYYTVVNLSHRAIVSFCLKHFGDMARYKYSIILITLYFVDWCADFASVWAESNFWCDSPILIFDLISFN